MLLSDMAVTTVNLTVYWTGFIKQSTDERKIFGML